LVAWSAAKPWQKQGESVEIGRTIDGGRNVLHRITLALMMIGPAVPAAAFSCTVSPDQSTVIVRTSNPAPRPRVCTVDCRFETSDGPLVMSCTQLIPGGAKDWYVCVRATGGKALRVSPDGGSEQCVDR
jgi:hypothetical protein